MKKLEPHHSLTNKIQSLSLVKQKSDWFDQFLEFSCSIRLWMTFRSNQTLKTIALFHYPLQHTEVWSEHKPEIYLMCIKFHYCDLQWLPFLLIDAFKWSFLLIQCIKTWSQSSFKCLICSIDLSTVLKNDGTCCEIDTIGFRYTC